MGVLKEEDRVVGVRLATRDGEREVRCRIVVGADGRHSRVARDVTAVVEEEAPPYRALYYRYVRGFAAPDGGTPDGAEFSQIGDELAYIFPSDDGVTCVALSINRSEFEAMRKSLSEGFAKRIAAHPAIASRFSASEPEGRLLGSGPEPNYVRVPVGAGCALVGDAGMHQDPFSGLGMDMASTQATYLAEELLSWFSGAVSEQEALGRYHERRNEHGLPYYRQTVQLAPDLRQMG